MYKFVMVVFPIRLNLKVPSQNQSLPFYILENNGEIAIPYEVDAICHLASAMNE